MAYAAEFNNAETAVRVSVVLEATGYFVATVVDVDAGLIVGRKFFFDQDAAIAFANSCVADVFPAGTFAPVF